MMFKRLLNWIKLNKELWLALFKVFGLFIMWRFAFDGINLVIQNRFIAILAIVFISVVFILCCPKPELGEINEHQ